MSKAGGEIPLKLTNVFKVGVGGVGGYFVLIGPGPSQPTDQLFRRENIRVHLQDSVLRTSSCFGAELSLCDKWSKEVEKLQRR